MATAAAYPTETTATADARRMRRLNLSGKIIAVAVLLALWVALSIVVRPWVPTPQATVFAMFRLLGSAEFYTDLSLTLMRGIQLYKNFCNLSYPVLTTTQNDEKLHIFIPNLQSSFLYGYIIHEETYTDEMNVSEHKS